MSGYTNEELRRMLIKAENALREVYKENAPWDMGKRVPVAKFAKMTRAEVNARWDFPVRNLMHRIARILAV